MQLQHFKAYTKTDLLSYTKLRRFETKLGERLQVIEHVLSLEGLRNQAAKYVVVGIPEDIGVQANAGKAGTSTAWLSFLKAFLNIQNNEYLNGDTIALGGYFDFTDLQQLIDKNAVTVDEKIDAYRHAVTAIDEEVEKLVKWIVSAGKFPILIGGGHNNAYPILKGAAKGLQQVQQTPGMKLNCINLDAHTDFRTEEGRHSGNAFRYAVTDGYLHRYSVIGIHENYVSQNVWLDFNNNPNLHYSTYEDIFIHEKQSFAQAVNHAIRFTEDTYTGIELDLDSIENTLSSAMTPCGITTMQARQYLGLCAARSNAAYLHICEGAAELEDGKKNEATGKLLSYLVSDFIKMHVG